ncbi:MAG: PorT family protein [Ferruginibacter sp.]|nr:PorT family protein [Ferruginibacter sp.]
MKKIAFIIIALISFSAASAQLKQKKDWSKVNIEQAGDHLMLQLSSDHWSGATDSINSKINALSRGFNVYIMMNKPFKTDPRWSVAFGIGVSTSGMYFNKTKIDVNATSALMPFTNLDSSNYYKKFKLATSYLEVPIELRYTFDPTDEAKSWKLALGVKIGTMLNVHTKAKTLLSKTGGTLSNSTEKQANKQYFNTTRLMGTARVGIGHWSLFGNYSITTLLKDAAGPSIRPFQIGITLSGL